MRVSRLQCALGLGLAVVALGCSDAGTSEVGNDAVEPVAEVAQALVDPGVPAPVGVSEMDYGSVDQNSSYGTNFPKVEFLARAYYPTDLTNKTLPLVIFFH